MNGTGCILDPLATDEFREDLRARGFPVTVGDARPDLQTYAAAVAARFDWEAEEKLFGAPVAALNQGPHPVCVSQGAGRAYRASLLWEVAFGVRLGQPVDLALEAIYGARERYRRLNGPGMVGADAARFLREVGIPRRGVYGGVDLREPDPGLAEELSRPNAQPDRVRLQGASRPAMACWEVVEPWHLLCGVRAGYFGFFCSGTIWGRTRNRDGMCRPESRGGHCVQVAGVCRNRRGDEVPVLRQSWGDFPQGGGPLALEDGREVPLPQGCYGVYLDDFWHALEAGGECWLVAPPLKLWRK